MMTDEPYWSSTHKPALLGVAQARERLFRVVDGRRVAPADTIREHRLPMNGEASASQGSGLPGYTKYLDSWWRKNVGN
jgi:hypothetical protein